MNDNTIQLVKDLALKSNVCKLILKDKSEDNFHALAGLYKNGISIITQDSDGMRVYDNIYHVDIANGEYSSGVLKLKDHSYIQSVHFLKTTKLSKKDLN